MAGVRLQVLGSHTSGALGAVAVRLGLQGRDRRPGTCLREDVMILLYDTLQKNEK